MARVKRVFVVNTGKSVEFRSALTKPVVVVSKLTKPVTKTNVGYEYVNLPQPHLKRVEEIVNTTLVMEQVSFIGGKTIYEMSLPNYKMRKQQQTPSVPKFSKFGLAELPFPIAQKFLTVSKFLKGTINGR